jgi:hypothetical protein
VNGLSHSQVKARARREQFCELRRQGVTMWDAAREVGVREPVTAWRYERWFAAAESGQAIVPGRPGRVKGTGAAP